ncbi:MAG: hypothetical protein R2690_15810 [Acidimicrobiales bacterium]
MIIWLWFFVAVGVYLYRGSRWLQRRGDPDAEPQPTRGSASSVSSPTSSRAEAPSPTEALFRQAARNVPPAGPRSSAAPSTPPAADAGAPGGLVLPATPPTTDGPGARTGAGRRTAMRRA